MKSKSLFLSTLFFIGGFFLNKVSSQDLFEGQLRELTTEAHLLIQEEIYDSSYYVFNFPFAELSNNLKELGEDSVSTIQFKIDGLYDWQMALEENEIRSNNYLLAEASDTGLIVRHKGKEVNTYKGFIDGDSTQWIRLYVSDSRMGGLINFDGDLLYLKPLMDFIPDLTFSHFFILFKAGDEKNLEDFICLTNDTIVNPGDTLLTLRSETERYLEYAVDVDQEFFDNYRYDGPFDEIKNVENVVLQWINEVDGFYHETSSLNIQLVYLNIWTTANDPYEGSTYDHWGQLQSYWNGAKGCVNKDAAILLSGKNLLPADGYVAPYGVNSICGVHKPPGGCPFSFSAYAVVDDNGGSVTLAHELGHNFGLQHDCTVFENNLEPWKTTCNVMWTGSPQSGCPDCPNGPVFRFSDATKSSFSDHLEVGKKYICFYDEENEEWIYWYEVDYDVCLRSPALMDYDFNILLEPYQLILGDSPICDDEFTLKFNNAFDPPAPNMDVDWGLGPNLTLVSETQDHNSITLESTAEGPTYVTVTFDYNCEHLTFKKEFCVGRPGKPGIPYVYEHPNYNGIYNVGVQDVFGAEFYMVAWEVCLAPGPCEGKLFPPLEVDYNDPLFSGITEMDFLHLEVAAGNECGVSDYTVFEWMHPDYRSALGGKQENSSIEILKESSRLVRAENLGSSSQNDPKLITPRQKSVLLIQKQATIFPNPAIGKLTLRSIESDIRRQIKVCNLMGQTIQSQYMEPGLTAVEIDTNGWKNGVYLVILQSEAGMEVLKVVVQ